MPWQNNLINLRCTVTPFCTRISSLQNWRITFNWLVFLLRLRRIIKGKLSKNKVKHTLPLNWIGNPSERRSALGNELFRVNEIFHIEHKTIKVVYLTPTRFDGKNYLMRWNLIMVVIWLSRLMIQKCQTLTVKIVV